MKQLIVCLSFLFIALLSQAQKENSHFSIYGDAGIPVGDFGDLYKMGFGGLLKYSAGLKNKNDITFTTGISFYTIKLRYTSDDETQTYRVIPFLIGYRHHINSFFVEPQIGVGAYQMRHEFKDQSTILWHSALTTALVVGYVNNGYEMGLRFQTGIKKNDNVSVIALAAGYHFPLKRTK